MGSPLAILDYEMSARSFKLRVRYCGGCNPDIDRRAVVQRALEVITASGIIVEFADTDADIVLLVNGCPHACLEDDDSALSEEVPRTSIQGAHVDHEPVPEACIHKTIAEWIGSKVAGDNSC